MKKRSTSISTVTKVKQIIETDSIEAVNALLDSGNWILLNSYCNRMLSKTPICRLGRIADYENESKTE